jgi:cytochrome d ubiquinol oxidase subunit I
MVENVDLSLVDWSRGQFALTAMFHWIFVPLTLGLGYIVAFMETIYVKTGDPEWKRITKFWMNLFGINFAIGVATGIILEFQFGTNWSNYSWFVGDIFGAPLAIEGIMAFFMESTFIAVMFFGWDKVSKKFHLTSSWLTAIGANLSALWILVANAWMQNPVGMKFNPDTARNEMENFWDILFSPTAVNKFLHTTTSGFVLASVFVVGISAWFLLHKRNQLFAKKSIVVGSIFGLIATVMVIFTGDGAAKDIAKHQPMKLAAMEGLYQGEESAPLMIYGFLSGSDEERLAEPQEDNFIFNIPVPGMLSFLANGDFGSFVPGVRDMLYGNEKYGILSFKERIKRGHIAQQTLKELKEAQKDENITRYEELKNKFENKEWLNTYMKYFGYGTYYDPNPKKLEANVLELVPPVTIAFHAFHIMVGLGTLFLLLFALLIWYTMKNKIENMKWLLLLALWSIPLVYLAQQTGWLVAEVGRQPWVIQDMMNTRMAVSQIETGSVQITFWLFAITFVGLAIAEAKIMLTQIKKGPKEGGK